MPEKRKIGLLGGDRRQLAAAAELAEAYECAVWGFEKIYGTPEEHFLKDTVRCADWYSAVKGSDAVILPLPACRKPLSSDAEGMMLNAPLGTRDGRKEETADIPLTAICSRLSHGVLLCGGMLPEAIRRCAAEHGAAVRDYNDSEEFQIRNAVPTAEGAIAACVETMPVTIAGMHAAVFGYGRVGRTLAVRLLALGAQVTVAARSERDLAWAGCDGCRTVSLNDYRTEPFPCDAIFNTVPYPLFDRELLSKLPGQPVYFELASGNGGMDRIAAAELGIRVIPLPSLPGKTSPVTAGKIVGDVLRKLLETHFAAGSVEGGR